MTDLGGGFYSTQDADSEGKEGKVFVWTPARSECAKMHITCDAMVSAALLMP